MVSVTYYIYGWYYILVFITFVGNTMTDAGFT